MTALPSSSPSKLADAILASASALVTLKADKLRDHSKSIEAVQRARAALIQAAVLRSDPVALDAVPPAELAPFLTAATAPLTVRGAMAQPGRKTSLHQLALAKAAKAEPDPLEKQRLGVASATAYFAANRRR